jgi:capsular exopolysaccharide synthesis family protein
MGVKDMFFKYIRFLPVFILSLALALFGAYIYLRYSTPIFRATGTLLIKNNSQGGGNGDPKLNQLFMNNGIENIQNEIEVLRSRPLMQRVVDSLKLQVSYNAVGKIKSPDIYKQGPFLLEIFKLNDSASSFGLNIKFVNPNEFIVNGITKYHYGFGQLFENEHGVFRLIRNPYGSPGKEYLVSWQPDFQVAANLAGAVQVAPKPGTGILIISIETTNPEMSADIVNKLITEYGDMTKEDKNAEARQTMKFIDIRLDTLQKEIDSIQRGAQNYKTRNNLIDPEKQSGTYFEEMTTSDKMVNDLRLQTNVAEMVEDYLFDKKNRYNTVPSSLGLSDATLNGQIGSYNSNQLERKRLIDANVPVTNPLVVEYEGTIEKLRQNILEALKNLKSSLNLSINTLVRRSNTAETQVKSLPAKIKELADIQTKLDSKESLYKFLIERREETSISLASTVPNSKPVDMAYPSITPVKPNRRAIQMLAILIGIGIPALFIFMLEVVNDKISTRFDIEKITQAAILGEVGHSFADNTLIVTKTNRSMVAEQFRIIRSNLQYVLNKVEKPVILVTSSFSGEGKSFVATNLGAVMALAGKKTIVLEFDIRKPKIMSGLGLAKKPGITNFLLGKSRIEDLPVQVPGQENLFVLSSGPVPPNPSEMLLESKVTELFEWLKANFDMVLVDTAPVGMVSDAMTLGAYANCTLYIVRQGYTYKKQIALIDEFYHDAKLPKVSIVINDVKVKPGYGYYGYGRYGYGYGYSSGYYEEETPPTPLLARLFGVLDLKKWKRKIKKK